MVFVGFMKYSRHIFMGHEILFRTFDGPQKLRWLKHKISKLLIKEI